MKCTRCGFDNPDYLEYCQNCAEQLPKKNEDTNQPSWGFVKAPKWTEPDFSADSVSEDDVPADFVSDSETLRMQQEAARRAAAEAAAERARRAAEAAAAAKAAESARQAELLAAEEKRIADEKRAAERKAEQERLLAERRAAELVEEKANRFKQKSWEPDDDDDIDDVEDPSERRRLDLDVLGGIFKHNKKAPVRKDYEDEDEDDDFDEYDPGFNRRRSVPKKKNAAGKNKLNTAIRIASVVAVLAVLAILLWLLGSQIKSCSEARKSPTGTNKAPSVVANPDEAGTYLVTVYAKDGKVLVYETSDGTQQEATVKSDNALTFKVHEISLMPVEPVDSTVYQATPKVYIKNDDGTLTPIPDMPSVTLEVPAINVTYDCPDTIVSEDGHVVISGRIDFIGTDLMIGEEKAIINPDGSFSSEIVYEDTGDYTINVEGRLAGHQVYRHKFNVTVMQATPTVSLIEFPWEYGDTSFRQRVVNSVNTIEVRGKVPAGSTVTATCSSSDAGLTTPTVAEDGTFTFTAKLANPSDYTIHLTCTTESGQVSERDMHVQRQPEMSQYIAKALPMNYASFAYESRQAYNIKGTVTEILQEGDYYLALLELSDGNKLVLEYHNHYGSAAQIEVGKTYEKIYGRPMGINEDGIPQAYVWFIND